MIFRPHHILCVQNYVGRGYSQEFTHHMDMIVEELARDPEITIHEGCDDICKACPHNTDNTCRSLDKVDRMDAQVIKACWLDHNEKYNWMDLKALARERVFDTGRFDDICRDCQWYDICKEKLTGGSQDALYNGDHAGQEGF